MTIRDVARVAGVSVGTASKALNDRGQLRAETRAKVQAAAQQLGFRPNVLARGLLSGRTYTVGLLTTDSFGRFSIPVMLGAEDALGAGRISAFMCDTRDDAIRERHYVDMLLDRRVDGLIVTGRRIEPRARIGDIGVPVVYAMTQTSDPRDVAVIPDEHGGGAAAIEHLLATGRRRIGHVTGPQRFLASRQRADGAHEALRRVGLDLAGGEALYGEWSEHWGRQGADILLRADPDLDAVFCGSDQVARGVAETLRDRGRRIPGDVAVVGYDNWEALALGCRPPLTTIDMNLREIGRSAAEHLLAAVDGQDQPGIHRLACRLVVRESTDPADVGH